MQINFNVDDMRFMVAVLSLVRGSDHERAQELMGRFEYEIAEDARKRERQNAYMVEYRKRLKEG